MDKIFTLIKVMRGHSFSGNQTEATSPVLSGCESNFFSDLQNCDSSTMIEVQYTSAPSISFDDLFSDGLNLENIIETVSSSSFQYIENFILSPNVENQIDQIEPSDSFSDTFLITYDQALNSSLASSQESSVLDSSLTNIPVKRNRSSTNPLSKFIDIPNSNMKKGKKGPKRVSRTYPKKEYYRTKFIRSWKRFIRNILKNKLERSLRNLALNEAMDYVYNNKEKLVSHALTQNGPLTEGQSKRPKDLPVKQAKTFNNSYVRALFNDLTAQESFVLFVKSEFYNKDCEDLVERFVFSCCGLKTHKKICEGYWDDLKKFSMSEMIYR